MRGAQTLPLVRQQTRSPEADAPNFPDVDKPERHLTLSWISVDRRLDGVQQGGLSA